MEQLPTLLGQRKVDGELEFLVDFRMGATRWVSRRLLERKGPEMAWAIEQHLSRPENRTLLEVQPCADESTAPLQPARRSRKGFIRKKTQREEREQLPPSPPRPLRRRRDQQHEDEAEEESSVQPFVFSPSSAAALMSPAEPLSPPSPLVYPPKGTIRRRKNNASAPAEESTAVETSAGAKLILTRLNPRKK